MIIISIFAYASLSINHIPPEPAILHNHPSLPNTPTSIILYNSQDSSKDMNITSCSQTYTYQKQSGNLNLMGNSNTLTLKQCTAIVNIMGNSNRLTVIDCHITFNINGNGNSVVVQGGHVKVGVNGSTNKVGRIEGQGVVECMYSNGAGNDIEAGSGGLRSRVGAWQNWGGQNEGWQYWPSEQVGSRVGGTGDSRGYTGFVPSSGRNTGANSASNPFSMLQGMSYEPQNVYAPNNWYSPSVNGPSSDFVLPQQANNNAGRISWVGGNGPFGNPSNGLNRSQLGNRRNGQGRLFNFDRDQQSSPSRGLFQFRPNVVPFNNGPFAFRDRQQNKQGLSPQQIALLPCSKYEGKSAKCSICLEDMTTESEVTSLFCFHVFHSDCCACWLKKSATCPLCMIDVKQHLGNNQSA